MKAEQDGVAPPPTSKKIPRQLVALVAAESFTTAIEIDASCWYAQRPLGELDAGMFGGLKK